MSSDPVFRASDIEVVGGERREGGGRDRAKEVGDWRLGGQPLHPAAELLCRLNVAPADGVVVHS